jgi:hypothetical protein
MVGLGHPGVALTPPRGDTCQGMRGLSDSQGCMGDNLRAAVAGGAASHVGMCAAAAAVVVVHGGGPAVPAPAAVHCMALFDPTVDRLVAGVDRQEAAGAGTQS